MLHVLRRSNLQHCIDLEEAGSVCCHSLRVFVTVSLFLIICSRLRNLTEEKSSLRRAMPKKAFYFLGTEAFIDGLRGAIIRHTGVTKLRKEKNVGCWKLAGEGGSAEVMHWLYRRSTVALKRKKTVYTKFWS